MSWLDPDRLAALYGQKPLKKAAPAEGDAHSPQPTPDKKSKARRAECCHKYNQGKRCADCPLD